LYPNNSKSDELRLSNSCSCSEEPSVGEEEIVNLEKIVKIKADIANKLNKDLSEVKIKNEKECANARKIHKAEVKSWRKELGDERKEKIMLEKMINEKNVKTDCGSALKKRNILVSDSLPTPPTSSCSETLCSICAVPIADFKPKYFLGEMFNPACGNCDDSFEGDNSGPDHTGCNHEQQCVIRQPHPPPSPSMPFLVDKVSKYHEHMMSSAGPPGGMYERNETLLWVRMFGELYGLPDINPNTFGKYLESIEMR